MGEMKSRCSLCGWLNEEHDQACERVPIKINMWKLAFFACLGLLAYTSIKLTQSRLSYRCVLEYAERNNLVINRGVITNGK